MLERTKALLGYQLPKLSEQVVIRHSKSGYLRALLACLWIPHWFPLVSSFSKLVDPQSTLQGGPGHVNSRNAKDSLLPSTLSTPLISLWHPLITGRLKPVISLLGAWILLGFEYVSMYWLLTREDLFLKRITAALFWNEQHGIAFTCG